jgi:DNA-binding MarR family transcriptional regulator
MEGASRKAGPREARMDRTDMAGHLIRRLHQQSTQAFLTQTQAAGFDLTSVQFAALDAIAEQPGVDQAGLAATIGFDRATIGGVIERLEQKGWIRRVVSERDRRARELSLTPEGARIRSALLPIVRGLQDEILLPLAPAEREAFLALARRVVPLAGQGGGVPQQESATPA